MIFAYTRISTTKKTQKHDRQQLTIQTYADENNFIVNEWISETISGTVAAENRPLYGNMFKHFKSGDILIITDIDRIGRSADDVISELKKLKSIGVRVVALDVPYMNDWNNTNNDSMYNMIIDIVIKGHSLGRPKADVPTDFIREYNKLINGEYGSMSKVQFAKMLDMGRSTVYKYITMLNDKATSQTF